MKKISISLLIALMSVLLFSCGGSSNDDGSYPSSDDIVTQPYLTSESISEEPSVDLVESDVAQISCGENDYTDGGSLMVSCLGSDGDVQFDVYFLCDAGFIYYESGEQYDSIEGTCIKMFCINGGEDAYVQSCDVGDSSALAINLEK